LPIPHEAGQVVAPLAAEPPGHAHTAHAVKINEPKRSGVIHDEVTGLHVPMRDAKIAERVPDGGELVGGASQTVLVE